MLSLILDWLDDKNAPVWKGYLYCGISIVILTYKAAVASYAFTMIYDSAVLAETVLKGLIHHKLLVINPVAKKHFDNGKLTNLITNDLFRIKTFVNTAHQLIILPITLLIGTIFLYSILNWVAILMPVVTIFALY